MDYLDGEMMLGIGAKLKALRKSSGLNQSELADQLGVSRKHVVDIEAGRGTSLLVLVKLLALYNKSEKFLEVLRSSMVSPKEMFNREHR